MGNVPTYKYIKENSILGPVNSDDYKLSDLEVYRLYSFYVIYSMCEKQSRRKRELTDYGWDQNDIVQSGLRKKLKEVLPFENFIIAGKEDNLKTKFDEKELTDGTPRQIDIERGVIDRFRKENSYFSLFAHIRNAFAHGKFTLRENSHSEKMVIMQDDDGNNVTARIILKLDTLINIIKIIDRNGLIIPKSEKQLPEETQTERIVEKEGAA